MFSIGSKKIVSDSVVGVSGAPVRLFGLLIKSDGTGTVVNVYNGTSTGGVLMDECVGTASVVTRISYPGGLLLPAGAFLDVDAHTTYCVAIFEQVASV